MTKKVYKQKCVAVITKNSNWENKNLVTLKEIRRGDGSKTFCGSWENLIFRGFFSKNQFIRRTS